jgi:xanthine dehydrogenase accessory factor
MINQINKYIELGSSFCVATLVNVRGSAPQDQGAKIIILPDGSIEGTIGGGKIENHTIEYAKNLLNGGEVKQTFFETWNLQKDIGMTCGGEVSIFFEVYNKTPWNVVIFGAGHVSQSLVKVLALLKCNLTVVDNRKEWLSKIENYSNVKIVFKEDMSSYIKEVSDNSFIVIMTMGHSTDLPILKEILVKNSVYPFLGVIGSKSKRNTIEKELSKNNIKNTNFLCPIGLPIGDNSPAEIAMSISAQLLEYKDDFFQTLKRQS